ncbi:DUF3887 domain-containing protein [Olivibacter sp. XZL3]|uniref:alpha/beta hydrolase n=1 Tax=Olivibacter sp. XZL3 TaxID=1735116 RepID=UPI001065F789|nr:DUF3887 domain-containing protein [Olivibacter sp. XZL3]
MRYIFILFTFLSLGIYEGRAQSTNGNKAAKFISLMADSSYKEALDLTSVDFKAKVSPAALSQIWEGINRQFGAFEQVELPDSTSSTKTPLVLQAIFKDYILPLTFHFNTNGDISGFFIQQQPKIRANTSKSPANFPEEALKIKVNGGIISGTLMTPKNPQAGAPVALIIAGSGPTDRNGNNLYGVKANSYLLLAEALADNGIASFRYDKRLVGESANFQTSQNELVVDDFVNDAVILGNFLKTRKEFGKLYIIGHSEGSNIGMLASEQLNPAAFISLCGPGENLSTVLERQLLAQPSLKKQAEPIIELLKQGKTTNNVPTELNSLFAPVVQGFLISSFKIDPAEEIRKLKIPVLIVGGTTDLQVPVSHAEKLKAANPKATLLLVKNMNHTLKTAPRNKEANIKTYTQPGLPLNSDLVIGLVNFLR